MIQWLKEQISRTTIANIVAAIILVTGAIYSYKNSDVELLKALCFIAAGYLFGVSAMRRGDRSG
jgi:hypothetical protein